MGRIGAGGYSMGSLIIADPWLETLAAMGDRQKAIAGRLIRMQTLAYNRIGHELRFSTEYLRRRITHSARYGALAECVVVCHHCGTQATLANWEAVALLSMEERRAAWRELRRNVDKERLAYMVPCPGAGYASDVAASDALPGIGKR
jgi:hypothetical protein